MVIIGAVGCRGSTVCELGRGVGGFTTPFIIGSDCHSVQLQRASQRCASDGPASPGPARHWHSVGPASRVDYEPILYTLHAILTRYYKTSVQHTAPPPSQTTQLCADVAQRNENGPAILPTPHRSNQCVI